MKTHNGYRISINGSLLLNVGSNRCLVWLLILNISCDNLSFFGYQCGEDSKVINGMIIDVKCGLHNEITFSLAHKIAREQRLCEWPSLLNA